MKTITYLLLILSFSSWAKDEQINDIQKVNNVVSNIVKKANYYSVLELRINTPELESVPPTLKFFYSGEDFSLTMLEVTAGHETFLIKHTYYIKDDQVIKYLKETIGRPNSQEKQAIIYGDNGSVLWKNIEQSDLEYQKIINLFHQNIKLIKEFSRY